MTTQTSKPLNFGNPGKGRGWKDAFVVSFLAIVLGAFVTQISAAPTRSSGSQPVASACVTVSTIG